MKSETLELMLQAERRDIPAVTCLAEIEDGFYLDPFEDCDTVVKFVKESMEFDLFSCGEIDAVDQGHFLRGPNYDPQMDPDYAQERRWYGDNK